jgi:hypothetical protein
MDNKLCCKHCKSTFGSVYNLTKHVKKFHFGDEDYLKTLFKRDNTQFNFSCNICHKNFNHKKNLTFHAKTHERHNQESETSTTPTEHNKPNLSAKCAMCHIDCRNKKTVLQHYVEVHDIRMKEKSLEFSKLEEFYAWKQQFEYDTNSKFVRESSKKWKTHKYLRFICHRSGQYVPEGKGILRTLIDCTFFDRKQTQRLVWRELICRDTTVFYIT